MILFFRLPGTLLRGYRLPLLTLGDTPGRSLRVAPNIDINGNERHR